MRSKQLIAILILSLVVISCSFEQVIPGSTNRTADTKVRLTELQGLVEVKNPSQAAFVPAAAEDRLDILGQLRTGENGHVRLELGTGSSIRLAPGTLMTLSSNQLIGESLVTRLDLAQGQVWVSLNGGSLEISTPSGTAAVRGSHMSARIDPRSQDVWVNCMEGVCQASNPTSSLDMMAGQGTILYHADPALPAPAPEMRYLTEDELIQFIINNPEVQEALNSVVATASALPSLTPKPTSTPVTCFTLTSPVEGTLLPPSGPIVFNWTEQPGRYKFILTLIKPDGTGESIIVMTNTYELQTEGLPKGQYLWKVTAYDSNIQPICSAGPWSFTRPEVVPPTATALPPVEPPTAVPASCVTLLTPADGASEPAMGPVDFTWTVYPGAYKYILSIKPPHAQAIDFINWEPQHRRYMESLKPGGTYQWWITVKDKQIQDVCTSGTFTFTKPETILPTQPPPDGGNGSGLFWGQNGPSGLQSTCQALTFSVSSSNPSGGMVKVIYSLTSSSPDGNSEPHEILSKISDTTYSGTFSFAEYSGKTIYWRFAIFDGAYTHDTYSYSFSCP